jgi:hypothetical protein
VTGNPYRPGRLESGTGTETVTDEQFYAAFIGWLRETRPSGDAADPGPDTHLWATGYLNSIAMLEMIFFLEQLLDRELQLNGDFLPTFFTMRSIYEAHVAPERTVA